MKVLLVKLRGPFYSVKMLDVYQVATTLPFIPPSTLIGAIGNGLAYSGACKGINCLNKAMELVTHAREVFVKEFAVAISPIVLRRAKKVLEDKKLPRNFKEVMSYNDAMVREYSYSPLRLVIVRVKGELELVKKALYLMERLGDSESLVAVEEVKEVEEVKCNKTEVNTVTKLTSLEGMYTVMPSIDERGERVMFSFPLLRVGPRYELGRIKYDRTVCAGEAIYPEGDDW
ncbi:type I-A CRISPR-associated protein Cas5a [Infirmifilum sp.]|uniref:type I-A CRISPR-associated protein Cas5a n=1 Tax=Infirmifilum sp. TaxID=2856575 RepID=UPI003D11B056